MLPRGAKGEKVTRKDGWGRESPFRFFLFPTVGTPAYFSSYNVG
jgi:hypothetical protein